MVMKNTVDTFYEDALNEIDLFSDQYQDTSALIEPLFVNRLFSAILVIFLMISIVRFMGNWSPYLKCYGLVMIRFNKESWFLLLVLMYYLINQDIQFLIQLIKDIFISYYFDLKNLQLQQILENQRASQLNCIQYYYLNKINLSFSNTQQVFVQCHGSQQFRQDLLIMIIFFIHFWDCLDAHQGLDQTMIQNNKGFTILMLKNQSILSRQNILNNQINNDQQGLSQKNKKIHKIDHISYNTLLQLQSL